MAGADNGVIVKYECSACYTQHDYESMAEECCQPDVNLVYVCPICETDHESRAEAEVCIAGHAEIEGEFLDSCPSCMRSLETAKTKVEVAITGHCSTCNPIYTPEQNLAIKYALEPKD
jgi:hypothetical protein